MAGWLHIYFINGLVTHILNKYASTLSPKTSGFSSSSRILFCGLFEIITQRVHVSIWYILRAPKGSHIPTLRAKYIPYSYMDPLGKGLFRRGGLCIWALNPALFTALELLLFLKGLYWEPQIGNPKNIVDKL